MNFSAVKHEFNLSMNLHVNAKHYRLQLFRRKNQTYIKLTFETVNNSVALFFQSVPAAAQASGHGLLQYP